jgi:putative mycofactocin binding protein MftB
MQFLQKRLCLAPGIRMRREQFGGTLYDHKTGKITFIYNTMVINILEQKGKKTVAEVLGKKNDEIALSKVIDLLNTLQAKGLVLEVE